MIRKIMFISRTIAVSIKRIITLPVNISRHVCRTLPTHTIGPFCQYFNVLLTNSFNSHAIMFRAIRFLPKKFVTAIRPTVVLWSVTFHVVAILPFTVRTYKRLNRWWKFCSRRKNKMYALSTMMEITDHKRLLFQKRGAHPRSPDLNRCHLCDCHKLHRLFCEVEHRAAIRLNELLLRCPAWTKVQQKTMARTVVEKKAEQMGPGRSLRKKAPPRNFFLVSHLERRVLRPRKTQRHP